MRDDELNIESTELLPELNGHESDFEEEDVEEVDDSLLSAETDLEFDEEKGRSQRLARRRPLPARFPNRPRRPSPSGAVRPMFRRRVAGQDAAPCTYSTKETENIRWVQSSLNRIMGQNLLITGVMNRATRDALRNFQKREGLPVDGIAKPETKTELLKARIGKRQPVLTEIEREEPTSPTYYSPQHTMEEEVGFDSPDRSPRPVRANFVSCNQPSGSIAAITGPDPVSTIQAANTRAIELLDEVICALQDTRKMIRAGKKTEDIVPDLPMRNALQRRFLMDADDRDIWTQSGNHTVRTVIRRFRGARQILADGSMKYTCVGGATFPIGNCAGSCVGKTRRAVSCGGHSRIVLCAPWWSDGLDLQATVLLHEALHIYFVTGRGSNVALIGDQKKPKFENAHCYHQFVLDMNWLLDVLPAELVGSCP